MKLMKVLLVVDDSFLCDMYATKFKELQHEVDTATSGTEALDKLEDHSFDAVLLDMAMPVMNGLDFLKEAKSLEKAVDTKFIVLSNQGEDSDRVIAKDAGAAGYIIKAESLPSDVVKKVESIIKE